MSCAGAILKLNSQTFWKNGGSAEAVSWEEAYEQGASGFWAASPNPTRLTIPAALDGKIVEFFCSLVGLNNTSEDYVLALYKNGTLFSGFTAEDGKADPKHNVCFGVDQVSTGDYYEVFQAVYTGVEEIDPDLSHFSAVVVNDRSTLDLITLGSNTAFSGSSGTDVDFVFDTVVRGNNYNTATGEYTVPAGIGMVIVRFATRIAAFDGNPMSIVLKQNGTIVRDARNGEDVWWAGTCFGPVEVSEGDVLKVTGDIGGNPISETLVAASSWASFEAIPT